MYNTSPYGQSVRMRRNRRRIYQLLWHHCLHGDGVCRLSLRTLSLRLGLAPSSIQRHLRLLVQDGYMLDRTPNSHRLPHEYTFSGKPLPQVEPPPLLPDLGDGDE